MNLLENYLIEIHEIKECNDEWTKDECFKGVKFLIVDATWNCHGHKFRKSEILRESQWENIKEKGYCMR